MLKRRKAQSIGEYVLVVMIVVTAAMAMFPMVKRGTQSLLKVGADQIGSQGGAEQNFSAESGYTENLTTNTQGSSQSDVTELGGTFDTRSFDESNTITNTLTNMGFTPQAN